jgi:hypothetical protein
MDTNNIDTRFRDFKTPELERIIVDGLATLRFESHLKGAIAELDQRIQDGKEPQVYDRWLTSRLALVQVGGMHEIH